MSIVKVHSARVTREFMLFVSLRDEEVMLKYNMLPENDRPMFIEYVQQEYPSVYAEWEAYLVEKTKRRLTE